MVDSSAYRFAFLIRDRTEIPADFEIIAAPNDFEIGLFLPQDHSDRFSEPKYVPHLLLLSGDKLQIHPHPAYRERNARISVSDVSVVERAQFLLSAWIRLTTTKDGFRFPYPRREEAPVKAFLKLLAERILPCDTTDIPSLPKLSAPSAIAMSEALRDELLGREKILIEWSGSGQGNRRSDLLAITTRRLIWMSKTNQLAEVEEFGYRLCYTSLQQWHGVRHERRELKILVPNAEWTIPISASDITVEQFALAAQRALKRNRLS